MFKSKNLFLGAAKVKCKIVIDHGSDLGKIKMIRIIK